MRRTTKITAAVTALAITVAACGPPVPPEPLPAGTALFVGTQRLDGLVCNAQGCLVVCTATLHISVTLGLTGANVDSFVDFSSQPDCHPSGWAMLASVDCQPDCGFQDVPTLAGTSRTPMAFKRVPSLATLVVEFQGVYNGQWGHADGRTPVIHCDTSRCIFSA